MDLFLEHFLREGSFNQFCKVPLTNYLSDLPWYSFFCIHLLPKVGVIEAFPPSDSVTCLTVDLLVEPGGDVCMLSCGDQLRGPSGLEVVAALYLRPPSALTSCTPFATRVGQACQQRSIMGHISLDLVTFWIPATWSSRLGKIMASSVLSL